MYLTLEVVSPQAAAMGAERRRRVGSGGLTIGREPGNDWVIPDRYVSRNHARISFADGRFFVEGLGRNPIAIGRSDNTVQANQPRPLNNGDRLFIDQYEMLVTVQQGEIPGAPATASPMYDDDPFALIEPAATPAVATVEAGPSGIPDRWDDNSPAALAGTSMTDTASVDPLDVFNDSRTPAEPEPMPVNWQQASPLTDHVELPPVSVPPASSSGIPDNWGRTGLTHVEPVKPVPQVRRPAPAPRVVAAAPVTPAPAPTPPASAPTPAPPPVPAAALDFVELLRGAGLSDPNISPETLRELGQALRVVVQGVMEVLHARTEIKSQFRLPLTRVKSVDNNPLKQSPNVESALHKLLVERNPGYLGTVAAFEDAFTDIRAHQLAMLEGMRAAFESMLTSFAPEELEQQFERSARGGLLGGWTGRSKNWEFYAERFARLRGDPEDTFRRLFGEVFAESYEKQLERLKNTARHSGHN